MLNSAVITIKEALLEKIDLESVSYNELLNISLPAQLKSFLSLKIEEDIAQAISSSNIPYVDTSQQDAKTYVNTFIQKMVGVSVLSRQELSRLLEESIEITIQYLIDPVSVMTSYIYRTNLAHSNMEILTRLSLFKEYDYLISIMGKYFSRPSSQKFTKEIFLKIVNTIYAKIMERFSPEKQAETAMPLFRFLSIGNIKTIDIEVIEKFFSLRKLETAQNVLKKIASTENKVDLVLLVDAFKQSGNLAPQSLPHVKKSFEPDRKVNLNKDAPTPPVYNMMRKNDERIKVDKNHDSVKKSFQPDRKVNLNKDVPTPPVYNMVRKNDERIKVDKNHDLSKKNTPDVPRDAPLDLNEGEELVVKKLKVKAKPKILFRKKTEVKLEEERIDSDPVADWDRLEEGKKEDAKKEDTKKEDAKDKLLEHLNSRFTPKEKKKIIKRLFRRKEMLYNKGIEEISQLKTWKEVSGYIEVSIFEANKADIFSDEAILFTDILHKIFSQSDET